MTSLCAFCQLSRCSFISESHLISNCVLFILAFLLLRRGKRKPKVLCASVISLHDSSQQRVHFSRSLHDSTLRSFLLFCRRLSDRLHQSGLLGRWDWSLRPCFLTSKPRCRCEVGRQVTLTVRLEGGDSGCWCRTARWGCVNQRKWLRCV